MTGKVEEYFGNYKCPCPKRHVAERTHVRLAARFAAVISTPR